jgi:hypothetical protein
MLTIKRVHSPILKPCFLRLKLVNSKNQNDNASENGSDDIFDCPEQGCNCVFSSFDELEIHLDVGKHQRFINNEGVYDTLKR